MFSFLSLWPHQLSTDSYLSLKNDIYTWISNRPSLCNISKTELLISIASAHISFPWLLHHCFSYCSGSVGTSMSHSPVPSFSKNLHPIQPHVLTAFLQNMSWPNCCCHAKLFQTIASFHIGYCDCWIASVPGTLSLPTVNYQPAWFKNQKLLPLQKPLKISHLTKNKLWTFPHILKSCTQSDPLLTSLTSSITTIPLTHLSRDTSDTSVFMLLWVGHCQPQGLCTCCTISQYCFVLDLQLAVCHHFTESISPFSSLNLHFSLYKMTSQETCCTFIT